MKIVVLAALIAAVSTGSVSDQLRHDKQTQGPWQVGKLYRYNVDSWTLARLPEGSSSGSAFKSRFIIRVLAPGRLQAKLENPTHAQVHQELLSDRQLPADLKYQPLEKLDQIFEINVEGGRVLTLNLPSGLPLTQENLLKGLVSALQVDLSTYRLVGGPQYGYDKEVHQGMFKKMETDVTGDCETLYNVYPAIPEWRRELPSFVTEEPIMVSKTKNYGHCHHRVAYHFGVPEGSEWAGTAHKNHEEQFMRRATVSRIFIGKQGPIFKTETTSTVHVNPQLYGKDKAEVISYVQLYLVSYEIDKEVAWPKLENSRVVNNLLYSVSQKQVNINDNSASTESSEEYIESPVANLNTENRVRRSAPVPKDFEFNKVVEINKVVDYDTVASSSSSSSDSTSTFENDDIPKINEPAYAALYMSPQARSDKKQIPMNVQKLVQEIAQQLQNPNNMPKADFLTKFNVVVRLIASMSYEQLSLTSRTIEIAKTSNNIVKTDMWMIYRDAVAQAGTLPAFQQIKSWILSKKIQGEEAAEVVASLPVTLRYPTKEIMTEFFKLAVSEEVRQQKYLNATALIAATRFINMGQVNNETAHSYYPTHMYGRLARQHDSFVLDEVLPRLSQDLKQAIQLGDSVQAQVYIKAIGNLGHRAILQVFAPYLEGKIPVSVYLRTQIVRSLQVLAHQRDDYVRAVLFSILKNIALPYEIRVAAIDNIFMARPTSSMMTAMAQMTHDDPSVQIRAVLKSSIESAAELKNPRYADLARTASAAKWMLTKEEFGEQYSKKYLRDMYSMDYELGVLGAISYTGSEDNFNAKYLRYSMKNKAAGWNRENTFSASVSSLKKLSDVLQLYYLPHDKESHSKYTAQKIFEMLNIKSESGKPLEGDFFFDFMGLQRYFAFDEHDVKPWQTYAREVMSKISQGLDMHYSKVLNQAQVSVMFPLCSGMPFIYKYKEPTVLHVQSKLKPKNTDETQVYDSEIQLTYARNIDGSVGFMDTLSNQYASVGVVSKLQIYLPFKLQLEVGGPVFKNMKISVEPLRGDQDNTIVHLSVWPYSACQKRDSLVTVALDPNTKPIVRNKKEVSFDARFGQFLGTNFQLQGYSYSSDYMKIYKMIKSPNSWTSLLSFMYQKDVAQTHFNFRYLGKQSRTKRITFTVNYEDDYQTKTPLDVFEVINTADVRPNSDARRTEMLNRVSSGIKKPKAGIVDISATFEGPQRKEYVLTAAVARSPHDPKIQYAIFAGRNSDQFGNAQINGIGKVIKPNVVTFNFLEALKTDWKMNFDASFIFGEDRSGNIDIKGLTERSKRYTDDLLNHPLGKQCSQEISNNNWYQYACHEMIVRAHVADQMKASVTYKNLSPEFVKYIDMMELWFNGENSLKLTTNGMLEIESDMSFLDETMNRLTLKTKTGKIEFYDVPIPSDAAKALAVYPPFKSEELVQNQHTNDQYMPFCTIDGSKIRTYSNRSYDYTLTRSWHVVMVDKDTDGRGEEIVLLARRPNEKNLEVYISYWNGLFNTELELLPPTGDSKEIIVKKTVGGALVENKPLDNPMYTRQQLIEDYKNSDGVVIINILKNRLRVMYDGDRVVILADENRGNIRGLCGRMTGDARDDYLAPTGLVDRDDHYGASYALKEADIDPKTLQLQEEALRVTYPYEHKEYAVILPADAEWRTAMESKYADQKTSSWYKKIYKSVNYSKQRGPCALESQTQYFEDSHVICISVTPIPSCPSHCKAGEYKMQAAQVVCGSKHDKQFREYKEQIRRGETPKITKVPERLPRQFQVPTTCVS